MSRTIKSILQTERTCLICGSPQTETHHVFFGTSNRKISDRDGFIAFLCCDICVALRFLALDGALPATIIPTVAFLVWVFYYPSQVLIANSSTQEPSERRKIAKTKRIS